MHYRFTAFNISFFSQLYFSIYFSFCYAHKCEKNVFYEQAMCSDPILNILLQVENRARSFFSARRGLITFTHQTAGILDGDRSGAGDRLACFQTAEDVSILRKEVYAD